MSRKKTIPQRVRIVDVAQCAGVSSATVSRVLNESALVPEATRDKVLKAIRETGFVRNALAGQLAGGNSGSVGIIVPTLTNPVFADSIQCIINALERQKFAVFVGTHEYSQSRETQLIRRFLEWCVDGLLLTGAVRTPEADQMLAASRCPRVVMWEFDQRRGRPTASFDNQAAARKMMEYLIGLGHRRIAFVSPPTLYNDRSGGRLKGYLAAMEGHGLPKVPNLVVEARAFGLEGGRECMAQLLKLDERPSAVFCGNDLLAAGCIMECLDRGVRVPGEISVSGFDDIELARNLRPALTTVRVPTREMSIAAAMMLERLIKGKRTPKQLFEVEVIVRDSTAVPQAAQSSREQKAL